MTAKTDLPLSRDQIAAIQALSDKARKHPLFEPKFRSAIAEYGDALCQQALRAIELEAELGAAREKFTMHTAHVAAWLSAAAQELGIGKEGDNLDVQTVLSQIMDKVAAVKIRQAGGHGND